MWRVFVCGGCLCAEGVCVWRVFVFGGCLCVEGVCVCGGDLCVVVH